MVKPDGVQRGLVGEIIRRFENKGFSSKRVMSYVRDCESLASIFGTLDYNLNILIKDAIDRLIENSNTIEINCPLGTNLIGKIR